MILGVDPGERRVGLAIADDETRFARPLEVVDARSSDPVARIEAIVRDLGVRSIVVGKPVGLSGRPGTAMEAQQAFVARLEARLDVPISEFDERLTSIVAERALRAGGGKARSRRRIVDAVAAQIMLQDYLDATR
ncbi:MAG: Holliday junction resolvase RuvX [Actinomycetota bacterium]